VDWWEDEFDRYDMYDQFAWAHFDVFFPVGEEVEIRITYTTVTQKNFRIMHEIVRYVLETGAGWYGPIGKGRIILRLPYRATPENVLLPSSTSGAVFTDSDVYWEFDDLEPTREDNWQAVIISPETWLEIVAARDRLESFPNNTSALLRLSKVIYSACVEERMGFLESSPEMFAEGLNAIKKAISLAPGKLEFHEQYALYLAADLNHETYPLLMEQLEIIRGLDPNSRTLDFTSWSLENFYFNQTATAQPAVSSTPQPSVTSKPTATLPPPTRTLTNDKRVTPSPMPTKPEALPTPPDGEDQQISGGAPLRNIVILVGILGVGGVVAIFALVLVVMRLRSRGS
jgi:hypothetical protein